MIIYTGSRKIVKRQSARHQPNPRERGMQQLTKNMVEPVKRGRKTEKEIMENLFKAYFAGNPPQIRNEIQG